MSVQHSVRLEVNHVYPYVTYLWYIKGVVSMPFEFNIHLLFASNVLIISF